MIIAFVVFFWSLIFSFDIDSIANMGIILVKLNIREAIISFFIPCSSMGKKLSIFTWLVNPIIFNMKPVIINIINIRATLLIVSIPLDEPYNKTIPNDI